MRIFIVWLLLFSMPAWAQDAPPEPRPFAKGKTTLLEPEAEKKKEAGAPKLHQPNVEMWLPPDFQASEGPWPLIVFSHGFGGCAKQSKFLTEYLAEHGYIVIAPDHADADCRRGTSGNLGARLQEMRAGRASWPERPFRQPETWTDKTEADRRDDVLFAVSSMFDDRKYASFIDKDKIGIMGHSLGGYTALGLAGGWPSWKDKRFKAVLALSPFADPFIVNKGLRAVHVPVMYQGGTRDKGITPALKKNGGGGYALTPGPKYFMELDGADHFAWTQLERDYQVIIQESARAFFDKYLKGEDKEIDYSKNRQVKTFWKEENKEEGKK